MAKGELSFLFVGDVFVQRDKPETAFAPALPFLAKADIGFCNLEIVVDAEHTGSRVGLHPGDGLISGVSHNTFQCYVAVLHRGLYAAESLVIERVMQILLDLWIVVLRKRWVRKHSKRKSNTCNRRR